MPLSDAQLNGDFVRTNQKICRPIASHASLMLLSSLQVALAQPAQQHDSIVSNANTLALEALLFE
jgi:hypothetical protein